MWLSFKLRDGRIGVCHESDVKSAAADPNHSFAKVQFRDGVEDEIIDASGHHTLADALAVMFLAMAPNVRTCRVCGCTDDDCSQCIAKTGTPCSWVEDDLCSACDVDAATMAFRGGPCPHCGARNQGNVFNCHACGKPFEGDPREPDGFPAPTGDGMRDLARIEAHMKEQTGITEAEKGDLSPLQDGNHPQLVTHRQRMGEATGDPMASAKALLARKGTKLPGDDGECETCGKNHFSGECS